jgi:outer membrane protein OmpA-like peptidoglycan-associated protein
MRVSSVLAFLVAVCAAAPVQAADTSNVTVNLEALPVPMPRWKPTIDELRPLAQARPRPKPTLEERATVVEADVVPGTAAPASAIPIPRQKPDISGTAALAQPAALPSAAEPQTPPQAPAVKTPPRPAAPVTIVTGPTTDETFPLEITGVAEDPLGPRKVVNPLEGFAVLSRVRFPKGQSEISAQAQGALDALAARLMTSRERVRLAAFSGKAGVDSSEARRLSLARALAIRKYLVSRGVPVERVDVLAFGGPSEGTTDRVDVLVRGI